MMTILLSGGAPLVAALFVVLIWHGRRQRLKLPRRRSDYVWAFIDGGILYVMCVFLVAHNFFQIPYASLLSDGFGETQVNVAFIAAIFEAFWSLWDMWNGEHLVPYPEA